MNAHAPESNFASEVALSVIDGEPRAYDLDIAKRLGFTNPLMIRKLIERHAEALAEFGVISTVEKTSGKKGGRPALEYWLTEPQSLYVAAKSEGPFDLSHLEEKLVGAVIGLYEPNITNMIRKPGTPTFSSKKEEGK